MIIKKRQKMKRPNYKTGTLLFITLVLVSLTISAQEVTKEFHKEYTAGANTTLEINNKYGDIVIQSWDKDQIVIDVKVTVEMPNRDKAEKLLGYIDVQFNEGDNRISAKTVIDDKFNFTGWGFNSKKFSIDYNIKMPASTALSLVNRYGNTDIDQLTGLVDLDIKYGDLTAGKLTRGNLKPLNSLNLAYGKGSIDEAEWFDLNLRYVGNMDISISKAILYDGRYSKLSLGETSSLVGDSKYDNIRIDKINNLVLENGYSEVKIGTLTKKLNYSGSYGSFSIEDVPEGFESIDVETHYMGVKLGISGSANYKLDAKVSYGGLNYDEENFRNQRRNIENNSKEIEGVVGKEESPSATVKVVASYGSVRLN
jgi:hypothetical protein